MSTKHPRPRRPLAFYQVGSIVTLKDGRRFEVVLKEYTSYIYDGGGGMPEIRYYKEWRELPKVSEPLYTEPWERAKLKVWKRPGFRFGFGRVPWHEGLGEDGHDWMVWFGPWIIKKGVRQ